MEDNDIVELFWNKEERAIEETDSKYGAYCRAIAMNILANPEDAKESVNDTYLAAWNSIPPHRPSRLAAFLGKLTRRISIDKWREKHAEKRGGGELALALDELSEYLPSKSRVEEEVDAAVLAEYINAFLEKLPETQQQVFIRRYWFLDPVAVIAKRLGCSQSKVKSILKRTRDRLMEYLKEEGML